MVIYDSIQVLQNVEVGPILSIFPVSDINK